MGKKFKVAYLDKTLKHFYKEPDVSEFENLKTDKPIDILLSVYNGMEFLPKLFESIFNNTTMPYRLIIVDNGNTDKQVLNFLDNLKNSHPNIVFIRIEKNVGFIKAMNHAMQKAENHFVLLNTDTELPSFWLERLIYPIIKYDDIASTTPFTNSGTVCSFPIFCKDSPIFDDYKVEELDKIFQYVKPFKFYQPMPSGVGFCMGMNYNVAQKIGHFDWETFGKGYGDENDWCMRASYLGYKNIIVPNLFVYHKHGAIYGNKEKMELLDVNLKKLDKKHPDYFPMVKEYIEKDPCQGVRDFVTVLASLKKSEQKPVLLISHSLGGGANFYLNDKIKTLLNNDEKVFVLTYMDYKKILNLDFYYKQYKANFRLKNINDISLLFDFTSFKEIFINTLVSFSSVLSTLDILKHIKETHKARINIPIHDFFPVCSSYNLLDYEGNYCYLKDISKCQECLDINPAGASLSDKQDRNIENWRLKWKEVLEISDEIICFSNSSREIIEKVFPSLKNKDSFNVIPHKVDYIRTPVVFTEMVNIGILGNIGHNKGSVLIKKMTKIIDQKNLNIRFVIIGNMFERDKVESNHLSITSDYSREYVDEYIQKYNIDFFFLPSIWPETFSYTTEEIMQLDFPLVCFNLGAQAERVKHYPKGLILDKIDADYAINKLIEFYADLKKKGIINNNIEINTQEMEAYHRSKGKKPKIKIPKYDLPKFMDNLGFSISRNVDLGGLITNLKIKENIINFFNSYKNKKICFWGAGLLAERFVEEFDLSELIILGFIDKDPSKKGLKLGSYNIISIDEVVDIKPDVIALSVYEPNFIYPSINKLMHDHKLDFEIVDNLFKVG